MLVVGLTGSIGTGKSTAATHFREHGFAVFDADQCVHALYSGRAAAEIEAAFPGSTENGVVQRHILSSLLEGSRERFGKLEAIVHPLVQAEEHAFLQGEFARGAAIAVLEVPLLFETGLDAKVDCVVVTSVATDIQRSRVLLRPGMSVEKLDSILALQTSDAEKRKNADFVVDTSGSIEASYQQIDHIVDELKSVEPDAFVRHWA